VIGKYTKIQQE